MIITMNTPFDACEVARQVQKAPDSVHWSQRKALAADLGRRMKEEGPFPEGIALLRRLAGDPKWEVRAEGGPSPAVSAGEGFLGIGRDAGRRLQRLRLTSSQAGRPASPQGRQGSPAEAPESCTYPAAVHPSRAVPRQRTGRSGP